MGWRSPLTKSWSVAKPAGTLACMMPSLYGSHLRFCSLTPPLITGCSF